MLIINSASGLLTKINEFSLRKILIYLYVIVKLSYFCIFYKPQLLYITIAQSRLGIIRDSLIIYIGSLFRCKSIIHLHGSSIGNGFSKLNKWEEKFVLLSLSKVAKCIVLSNEFIHLFNGFINIDKIVVVNNGIDDSDHRSDLRKKTLKDDMNILFVSNLVPQKGLEDLILAINLLKKPDVRYKLQIVGKYQDKRFQQYITNLIKDKNLSNIVEFCGQLLGEDKEKIYEKADIFVFPSRYLEGQPLVVLEAMRAGLPIIISTKGNSSNLIENNVNGLIFKTSDYNDLAKKIYQIVRNYNKRIELGTNARNRYETLYTKKKYLSNMQNIFEYLLEN